MISTLSDDAVRLTLKVRDYELDIQGIVNNSVYGNYLEHARHEFFLEKGVSFSKLAAEGIHLVVTRIEIDYKKSLHSRDEFYVETTVAPSSSLRFQFEQSIFRKTDDKLIVRGVVSCVAIKAESGRPIKPIDAGLRF
ncbi:MAG: acyl-CoA thioester hydrolase [Flavobacteriales bacterium]|jgi:acyl-CoA thioester hydrolase